MEEYLGDIGRARQLFEIATTTQADNAEIWNVSDVDCVERKAEAM